MSVYIEWKGRDILIGNNSTIRIIHSHIEDIIIKNNIKLNENLTKIVEDLDQAGSGFGFDLAECLHTKNDLLTFIDLVRQGIDKYNLECKDDRQETEVLIEEFYQDLMQINKSFPDNDILKCKRAVVDIIHIGTEYLKRENNIKLNENLTKIIENLNRAYSNSGFPLTEYLYTKKDITAFINLTKSACDKYTQICQNAQLITRNRLEGFYQELVKIAKSYPS